MSLHWKEHFRSGMQAFLNGNTDGAVENWKNAVSIAEETSAQPSAELAELYYCLGKLLADLRKDDDALRHLRFAVNQLEECMSGDQKLKVAQYALAEVLNRTGFQEERDKQFKKALDLPPHGYFDPIPLRDALKTLQEQGLCKDLKGGVLSSLCHQVGLDPSGDNSEITSLLLAYYCDEHSSAKRLMADRFFLSNYTNFETEEVLELMDSLSGEQNLLAVEEQHGDPADGDVITVTMQRSDGVLVYRTCQSVVGLVDEYNKALGHFERLGRFCSLDGGGNFFTAFFLEKEVQKQLQEARALIFDDMPSES